MKGRIFGIEIRQIFSSVGGWALIIVMWLALAAGGLFVFNLFEGGLKALTH